ncbi:MAG: hypothetical protein KGQ79_10750 [Proteobacteria bacterium]|nr:hypothetical protein [Pseudomonadota bacterium]
MTNNLKTRLRKLERGNADDVTETFVINDLPDPGDPDGAQAIVSGHEGRVFIQPGESIADFRARCCGLAGRGGWISYSMIEPEPGH